MDVEHAATPIVDGELLFLDIFRSLICCAEEMEDDDESEAGSLSILRPPLGAVGMFSRPPQSSGGSDSLRSISNGGYIFLYRFFMF